MRISRLSILALVVLAGACSSRDREMHQGREPEWRAPVEILLKYADASGGLTRSDLEAGLRRDFAAADLNHNGVLEPNEVRAVNAKRWDEDQSAISPLQDWNGDGVVDFGEFAATGRALFNEFDEDGNGILTPKELHPGGPPRGDKDQQGGQDEGGQGRGGPPGGGHGGHGGGGRGGRGGEPQQ